MRSANYVSILISSLLILACHTPKKTQTDDVIIIQPKPVKKLDPLQVKYGPIIGVPPENIRNIKLYKFIDEWLNTPYKWGGTDKKGIDCSAFVQRLLLEVYNVPIPRTSEEQFINNLVERFKIPSYAYEGDLVFFTFDKKKLISHVGLYLGNNKFVNSCSQGVIIADLKNAHWRSSYAGSGRIKINKAAK